MAKDPVISQMNADRPIESLDEDLLGRGSFCISLASAIEQWHGKESLVIGIYGPWGSGKTSVKNIVIGLLKKNEKPISVIEFNPWAWSGEDRIQNAFFDEIGDALSGVNTDGADSDELSKKWKKYATRLSLGGTALGHLKTAAEFAAIPWAPMILGGVSKALNQAGDVADQAAGAHEANDDDKNAEQLKSELTQELSKLEKPILIVIDDVDRLTTNEIRLLFRLVKANAAFPNLVFLLPFDRAVIEASLDEASGSLGREYMEKIVQVGFDIPRPQQGDLDSVLFSGLNEIIQSLGSKTSFESDRWQSIFLYGLQPFLNSLRKVRRFVSSFSFHVGLFSTSEVTEVNFVDLVALEALRVFEPDLYHALAQDRQIVFGVGGFGGLLGHGNDDRAAHTTAINDWLENSSEENRQAATEIAKKLFPQIEWTLRGSGQGLGFENGWLRTLRICHSEIFERYFSFGVSDGDVAQSFIKKIIDLSGDKPKLKELILGLKNQREIVATLKRLSVFAKNIPIENAEAFVSALCEIVEAFHYENRGMFGIPSHLHVSKCIHEFLMQVEDVGTRGQIALAALAATDTLWLPVEFVADEEPRDGRQLNASDFVFAQAQLDQAINICLDKIRAAAGKNKILGRRLLAYLWRWKQWSNNDEACDWANAFVAGSPQNALEFIEGVASTINSSARPPYLELNLRNVEPFVDVLLLRNQLEPFLQNVPDSDVQEIVIEKKEVIEAAKLMFEQWDQIQPEVVVDGGEVVDPTSGESDPAIENSSNDQAANDHWGQVWNQLNGNEIDQE